MTIRTLLLVCALIAGASAFYNRARERIKQEHACDLSSCYPATGNLLIGRESRLTASSTCGVHGEDRYCIVSQLGDRGKCSRCETTPKTENRPDVNHRVQNIIYKFHPGTRTKSWWQSENGVENVTIQLDLEAEFHFTHLIIEFKTFRPAAMLVERSYDLGKTWRVYRYFAHKCEESFPWATRDYQRSLADVICESRYSGVSPSSEGEVIFRVLPPNINVTNPYSQEVQNLLKITNLRINFTKLHTLGDDLLDDRPEIKEKYYYAIYEMIVRGSCSCYGHAARCLPMPGVESKTNMVHGRCECTHNTKGLNCEYCEDFYNDVPWQPASGKKSNACQRCKCNNHATSCHFDWAVFNATAQESGGVCDDCQHNTLGRNCEQCKPFYYQDPALDIQSPDVCKPCDCDPDGTSDEGMCDQITDASLSLEAGRCHCKSNVGGVRCDICKDGYWNFNADNPDGCDACLCNPLGTVEERGCDPVNGECTCKRHVTGKDCSQCQPEHYGLSNSEYGCLPCDCDIGGALDNNCDVVTGQCTCRYNITGRRCDSADQDFFAGALDFMVYEAEAGDCVGQDDPNAIISKQVLCRVVSREPFRDGREETWTGLGFMKVSEGETIIFIIDNIYTSGDYDILIRYEPQSSEDWNDVSIYINGSNPDINSPCANARPDDYRKFTRFPSNQRSILVDSPICLEAGKQYELRLFLGPQNTEYNDGASVLIDSIVLIPDFEALPFFNGNNPSNIMRYNEFRGYNCDDPYYFGLGNRNVPEICRKYHISIGFYILDGAKPCKCNPTGSTSHKCEEYGGSCSCKTDVVGRQCNRCAIGTYGFGPDGCKQCDCNNIGALNNFCDASSGQCKCRANTYGRQCDECQPGYFNFPNCQQCECNGHADTCDPKTGVCISCRDNTEGNSCDSCVDSYYGDPRLGIDIPCRACLCPNTIESGHSFASRCYLQNTIVCECQEGYAGSNCDVCADNYFGQPEEVGGSCEPCKCNDNTDLTKPGNCDPHTGKCLKCLYNTGGDHCDLCAEGYYGDALTRSCIPCNCSALGTDISRGACDTFTGQCPCLSNVVGQNCDVCAPNHWRIALGNGCEPCDCDPNGSFSDQCNLFVGQCDCKTGFGGRQCNQCQENYWGDPLIKCDPCECDIDGSISQQCMRENGSCICRPGIGGSKCNMCARGYLGELPFCDACGECFDNWDRIINDLRIQTNEALGNASQIKLVGATGAYTRDFDEMNAKLSELENLVNNTAVGEKDMENFYKQISDLIEQLKLSGDRVIEVEGNLSNVTAKVDFNKVSVEGLQESIKKLNFKTAELTENGTKVQETNLKGALNLTQYAKQRAMAAADEAEKVQKVLAETERQIKATDLLVERQYDTFNATQTDNDEKLKTILSTLDELESEIPKINEKMCGQESDDCGICGGVGCDKCGGISCESGALTKSEKALEFANQTEKKIKELELTADDLIRSISQAKQETMAVKAKAENSENFAQKLNERMNHLINRSKILTDEFNNFFNNNSATPAQIEDLANQIFNISISLQPDEITDLARKINETVLQLGNINSIMNQTRPNLETAQDTKKDASEAQQAAELLLDTAKKVSDALSEAEIAQVAAKDAVDKAEQDISSVEADLNPIASESEDAELKANETKMEVDNLRDRLANLQKKIVIVESDAQNVNKEASNVVEVAESVEQEARVLRQRYKDAEQALADKSNKTANSRDRAQELLNRATNLAANTNRQLNELETMESLYTSHADELNGLERKIYDLNQRMIEYLENLTKRSDQYRTCTS